MVWIWGQFGAITECSQACCPFHLCLGRLVAWMVYSHSHGDHYMGAGGVIEADAEISIIAPDGFMEAVLSESILAGPAMRRRGAFMYGSALPRSATGQIGTGLGMGSSVGRTALIPLNKLIQKTGEELVVDGVRIVFQMVPGTEAPAEINFHIPNFRALCIPETATNCMHNIFTLRGAQVRDAKAWSRYLDEAIVLFGRDSDVVFGSHNWPTWGQTELVTRLEEQRDLYGFMHDRMVRMMNLGMTGIGIAERMQLPPALDCAWNCGGFYGSLSHNVKGIYQEYLTWFDGRPEHLWQYPPQEEGAPYIECFGGVEALCVKETVFIQKGDHRFAATLLAHAVAANPQTPDSQAQDLLAKSYEQLGFGAENATWHNFYLTAAQELRTDRKAGMVAGGRTPLGEKLTLEQCFEILSVQFEGTKASETPGSCSSIDLDVTDINEKWRLVVSNGVLTTRCLDNRAYSEAARGAPADLSVTLTKAQLLAIIRGDQDVPVQRQEGRKEVLYRLVALCSVEEGSPRGPSQI
ncbi:hypothetical protein BDW72DRAFT_207804 [Aspergillus terricola var. indicus]